MATFIEEFEKKYYTRAKRLIADIKEINEKVRKTPELKEKKALVAKLRELASELIEIRQEELQRLARSMRR